MTNLDRRALLGLGGTLAAAASLAPALVSASAGDLGNAVSYDIRPLPFDPGAIAGLSEKLLKSHHERNYTGAVKRLGAIQTWLASKDPAAMPGFELNGLKREELIALNSVILHEIYFAGLGAGGSPGGRLGAQVGKDFGSFDKWRAEFAAMGRSLGGGSGWVLLTWSPRLGRLSNSWAFGHTMNIADGTVLVALDMYEHAYAMDYGARAGAYVDAFLGALTWTHADRVFKALGPA